jgi:hypothetical protein
MSNTEYVDKSTIYETVDLSTIYDVEETFVDPAQVLDVDVGVMGDDGSFIVGDDGEIISED